MYAPELRMPACGGPQTPMGLDAPMPGETLATMKTTLAIMMAALVAGCASQPGGGGVTVPPKEDRCAAYASVLALYQASTAFREPSKEEIMGAQAATAFLTATCGWQRTRAVDQWGVPIIVKP